MNLTRLTVHGLLSPAGLTIDTPAERPCEHAYVFKIVLGPPFEFRHDAN